LPENKEKEKRWAPRHGPIVLWAPRQCPISNSLRIQDPWH